ncbi:Clavaminate synthase-like protein [Tilletiopsis washingtonensis]|uniref:Clavaminate synthase-like protein n=1 Tax=Tilletiopsis washingtonensis TaxID=58919 RepID=A0A316Z9A3_9BASI|nr:Clavaminate synthase-like protein [Tilletiopsis washingtonensis]PWN97574.1 Clavaminate synthase-like protein [Tilletiopsis washingtonensis]
MLAAQAPATHHAASPAQASAGSRVPSIRNVLTSGQHDVDVSRLTAYSEMPTHIPESAPTIWRAEDYRGDENRHKWIRIWTAQEIEWLETAAKAWKASGRSLTEIERASFDLPAQLAEDLTRLRYDVLLNGKGFYMFKGLPVQRWGTELTAIAYLGIGAYLGNAVSQNGKGHLLGHVKQLDGADPTQIATTRIYKTTARQYFHTDSSGGLIGLVCLQTAQTGGESDIVSTQAVWNDLQEKRPDLAEELASPTWHFDRKGEVSEGQRPFFQKPIFYLVKGQPAERVAAHWDPYYVWSLGRHVEAGLIPELSERKKEAMTVLEETAQRLSLHMELEIGDLQLVSDQHVLHARTAYQERPYPEPRRHLLRLWLSTPSSEGGWLLPNEHSNHPRRGGIQVNQQPATCPLDAE